MRICLVAGRRDELPFTRTEILKRRILFPAVYDGPADRRCDECVAGVVKSS